VRDLLLWGQAQDRQERAELQRFLMLINSLPLVEGTVTVEDVYGAAPAQDTDEYHAFKGRTQGWAAGLVTDFEPDEM
jgi:hypothetical protein